MTTRVCHPTWLFFIRSPPSSASTDPVARRSNVTILLFFDVREAQHKCARQIAGEHHFTSPARPPGFRSARVSGCSTNAVFPAPLLARIHDLRVRLEDDHYVSGLAAGPAARTEGHWVLQWGRMRIT